MIIFRLIVLLYSAILHEIFHGYWAYKLGDDTAYKMKRLSLNPFAHLDPIGSLFFPILMYLFSQGRMIFGWARPVPYNPLKLKHPQRDTALLAFAGPCANLFLAFIFGLFIRLCVFLNLSFVVPFFQIIVGINLMLAVFNLIPVPPLDGSKILFYLFPSEKIEIFLNQYSLLFLFLILFWGSYLIFPIVQFLYFLFTGLLI